METESIIVTAFRPEHWEEVRAIYSEGIATGQATFETDTPNWDSWNAGRLNVGRRIAQQGGRFVGWAALSPVSDRCAYKGVAEVSGYVGNEHRGQGVGAVLLGALIEESEKHDIWTLQAGVFPENVASVRLHKRCGFREVGVRERLGRLDGR
jgi:L-amino acid N-acyltransferase YncA